MKRKILLAIMLTALTLSSAVFCAFAETEVPENMRSIEPVIDRSYESFRLRWEEPEDLTFDLYRVTLLDAGDENGEALSLEYSGSFINGEEIVLYYCQEFGVPDLMRFRVEAVEGDTVTAEGFTEAFDPSEFWPQKETLQFGTDIPEGSVISVSSYSRGETAEANWSYNAARYGGEMKIYYSAAGQQEKEKKLTKGDWDKLWSILLKGRMKRKHFSDPSVEVLDGSSSGMEVSWDSGEKDISGLYRFDADSEVREELQRFLERRASDPLRSWVFWLFAAALLILAAGAAVMIRRMKLN
ncbi:MAG: hypothetical protein IKD87_04495 [Oscillospiraceae bacterium]|nr:hypothetical protein [Oscillospiraceae bacterium]